MCTQGINYYVPIGEGNYYASENEAYKKQNDCNNKPRYTPRILGRRFALTHTAYKYLDIGINVGPVATVEILLGDNRGNVIPLCRETWTTFIEKRADVEQLLKSTTGSSLSICDLVLEVTAIRGASVIKVSLHDTCMYMKPSTVLFLFELKKCISHVYMELCHNTHRVGEKYKNFVTILQRNCIMNKREAGKILREHYDEHLLVDCEMLAFALDNIVYDATHNA